MLLYFANEYLATHTIEAGAIVATRFGLYSDAEAGKYTFTFKGRPGRFANGRDYVFLSEKEALDMAQKYDAIETQKSECTEVEFAAGELLIGNYFHPMDEIRTISSTPTSTASTTPWAV